MATQLFSNNISTTLSSDITSGQTSITLTDGSGLNSPGATEYELITFTDGTDYEIVTVTARSGNTITVTRGTEGTTAAAWTSAATTVFSGPTAGTMDQFPQGFDNDGDAKGADSVTLQPSRAAVDQVASGANAIALGVDTKSPYANTIAIGNSVFPPFNAVSRVSGLPVVGQHPQAFVDSELLNMTGFAGCISSVPIDLAGGTTWSSGLAPHNGDTIEPTTPNGFQYLWIDDAYPLDFDTSYTESSVGTSEPTWPTTHGASVAAQSGLGTFYAIDNDNYVIDLPTNARFIPTDVFILVHAYSAITVQPTISLGSSADGTALVSSLQLTETTARYAVQRLSFENAPSMADIKINLVTPATGTKLLVQFYFQGFVVVDAQFYVV